MGEGESEVGGMSEVLLEKKEQEDEVRENPEGNIMEENDKDRIENTIDSDGTEVKNGIEESEDLGEEKGEDLSGLKRNEESGENVVELCRSVGNDKKIDDEKDEKKGDEVVGENEGFVADENVEMKEVEEVKEKEEEEEEDKDVKEEKGEENEEIQQDVKFEKKEEEDEEMKEDEQSGKQDENQPMELEGDEPEEEDVEVEKKAAKGKVNVARKNSGGKSAKKVLPDGSEGDDEIEKEEKEISSKKGQAKESEKEEQEEQDDENEDEEKDSDDEVEEEKEADHSRKSNKAKTVPEKKSAGKNARKSMEPKTPATDRPQRERKTVERLVALIERDASKDFKIGKGRGTPLKDIPNVSLKLSKKKIDDSLKLLHTILFGRRGKAIEVKSNILRFSGLVWHDNEEKHLDKVREKFDKCNKEKLIEFCDLFDLSVSKVSSKKEDLIAKLMDFLEAPRATPTKESQSSKRKRGDRGSGSKSSSKSSIKRQKMGENSSNKGKKKQKSDDDNDDSEDAKDDEDEEDDHRNPKSKYDFMEEDDEKSESSESEESEEESKRRSSSSAKKNSKTKKTPTFKKSTPTQKRTPKMSSKSSKKTPTSAKKSGSKPLKVKGIVKPSDDELRDAICEILKEVDFNTATFTDILKLLGKRYEIDLTPRKESIKMMIQTELAKFADDEDDETERDGTEATGNEVEV